MLYSPQASCFKTIHPLAVTSPIACGVIALLASPTWANEQMPLTEAFTSDPLQSGKWRSVQPLWNAGKLRKSGAAITLRLTFAGGMTGTGYNQPATRLTLTDAAGSDPCGGPSLTIKCETASR